MELLDIKNVYEGQLKVQQIKVKKNDVVETYERTIREPQVVGICHDPVNDSIMLIESYHMGAMGILQEFPNIHVDSSEIPHEALEKYIKETTGAFVKSSTYLHRYNSLPSICYAPVEIYYCTYNSRSVKPQCDVPKIVTKTAKELIREVESGLQNDINVIYAAQYLKLLHNKLI